jgi:hypothetical protein
MEDAEVDVMIILRWILDWEGVGRFIWLRLGPLAGSCEHGNEHLDSTNSRYFLK